MKKLGISIFRRIDNVLFGKMRRQYVDALEREIPLDCKSILDVGCGDHSPLSCISRSIPYRVGIDAHAPSIKASRKQAIHTHYIQMDVLDIGSSFDRQSFDCVLACDIIEHLPKEYALDLIKCMEQIAGRKVIIFTPNGFVPQGENDKNPYQKHVCGWSVEEMRCLGYSVTGINGLKFLRGAYGEIKWWPRCVWGRVSLLTQSVVVDHPAWAFQLLCVKDTIQ